MQAASKQSEAGTSESESSRGGFGCLPVLLVLYLLVLAGLATWSVATETAVVIPVQESPDEVWVVRIGKQVACRALRDLLLFLPLGFLVAGTVSWSSRNGGFGGFIVSLILGIALSLFLAVALRMAISGLPLRRPSSHALFFAAVCCGLGCWAGATLARSRGVVGWFFGQLFLLTVLVVGVAVGLVWFGLDSTPFDFESKPLQTEDRRRLARLFQQNDPRRITPGETVELTLTNEDLNQLLSWGLMLASKTQKAQVAIEPESISVAVSVPLPQVLRLDRYLNLAVSGGVFAEEGQLGIRPQHMKIGRIEVPQALLAIGGPSIMNEAWQNKHTRPFLTSMKDIRLDNGSATVTYGHVDVSAGFLRDALVDLGGMENMAPATRAHVERLIERAESSRNQLDFPTVLQIAFQTAQERSASSDATHENRAAILALGYLTGNRRIRAFVGPELPIATAGARQQFAKLTIRGRNDWVRHFTVSAALTVLSNVATSDAVGLLKEELDADGGSGFSFPDLMADRAGTTLAQTAISDEQTARAMQTRLAADFDVDALFPPAADLPEGLTDAELKSEFGGVGGRRYQEVVDEIERRIAACTLYQQNQ